MVMPLLGIHHVTAIVDEPQENIDFYTNVLGLRLVKQTVNFDDPYTYHFYYGDEAGHPGTIVTFFPWPGGRRGSRGVGQISAIAFAVPAGALGFWQRQLREVGWNAGEPAARAGGLTLSLYDHAGLLLELVERPVAPRSAGRADIPAEAAIAGLYGVTMTIADGTPTAALLTGQLGFRQLEDDGGRPRFAVGEGEHTAIVTLEVRPDIPRGQVAAGSVHHVAWRVADEEALLAWRGALEGENPGVTPVRDRRYFRSIYFCEPGGVLFELATDPPGFTTDEPAGALGARLQLPPWLEPQREAIARRLPPLVIPEPGA